MEYQYHPPKQRMSIILALQVVRGSLLNTLDPWKRQAQSNLGGQAPNKTDSLT